MPSILPCGFLLYIFYHPANVNCRTACKRREFSASDAVKVKEPYATSRDLTSCFIRRAARQHRHEIMPPPTDWCSAVICSPLRTIIRIKKTMPEFCQHL